MKGLGALVILLVVLILMPIAWPFVLLIMILAGAAWLMGLFKK